ncbi:unnamed protein product, partial [Meganyctiphanes norvegica]
LLGNGGVIILVTANIKQLDADADALVSAAGGNSVWPILYPQGDGIDISVYETLAKKTGGHTFTVKNTTHRPANTYVDYQDVNNYHDLSLNMLQIQSNSSNIGALIEIAVKTCVVQDQQCKDLILEVDDPALYEDEYIIEIYSATSDEPTADFGNLQAELISKHETYKAYKIKGDMLQSNSFTLTVTRKVGGDIIKVTLLATTKMISNDYSVKVSASPSLENLHYTSDTAPVIYVQVAKNWDLVLFARVIATVRGQNINLHDNGFGADITGNDGIYSAYLLGVNSTGKADITFSVDDNNGSAKIIEVTNKAVPSNPAGKWCCGSEIDLNDVELVPAVNLSVISTTISGTVTGDPGYNFFH